MKKQIVLLVTIFILLALPFANPVHARTTVTIPTGSASNTSSPGYAPNTITVIIGVNNTVIWNNDDSAPHTVTSDTSGIFDSGNLNSNQSFSFTFTTPGTYAYHCTYHIWMHGTVNVEGVKPIPEFPVGSIPVILFSLVLIAGLALTRFRKLVWSRPASVMSCVIDDGLSQGTGYPRNRSALNESQDRRYCLWGKRLSR